MHARARTGAYLSLSLPHSLPLSRACAHEVVCINARTRNLLPQREGEGERGTERGEGGRESVRASERGRGRGREGRREGGRDTHDDTRTCCCASLSPSPSLSPSLHFTHPLSLARARVLSPRLLSISPARDHLLEGEPSYKQVPPSLSLSPSLPLSPSICRFLPLPLFPFTLSAPPSLPLSRPLSLLPSLSRNLLLEGEPFFLVLIFNLDHRLMHLIPLHLVRARASQ